MFGTKHGTFWFIQLSIQYKGDNIILKDIFKVVVTLGNISTEYKALKSFFLSSQQRSHKLQDEKY